MAYLRSKGEYDRAIELVQNIIKEYADSENVLRHAYNQLIFTLDKKNDVNAKLENARAALERFPDLRIEGIESNIIPGELNDYYDQLRGEMFGSVTVREPEGCRLFLNEKFMGETPLHLPLVRVGEYALVLTKSGYHDLTKRIVVDPSGRHEYSESLSRERGMWWWAHRLGPALVGGAIITYGLVRDAGGNEPVADQPLPLPPPPPAQ
ncbi:MAG: PEGA domain-containing protein [Chitinivibrionia bacterium]|nr:PEGA domain-containing protein [Chitinivibrionia bacterium]